jgi:glucose/mannose-6-phosphate isomerase
VIDLDDRAAVRAADPGGMLDAVGALPSGCTDGYRLGLQSPDLPDGEGVTAIAVCGVGGSAIAGDVLRALAAPRLRLPVVVVRTPELPEFVGPHTLVVATSYSGETSETLELFERAVSRGARLIAIGSGGKLARRAEELGVGRVRVPGGSMPRAAFGSLLLGSLGALEAIGVLPSVAVDLDEAVLEMRGVLAEASPTIPRSSNSAKALALALEDRTPVVWGGEGIGAVAAQRWKTQLNENAKVPAFASALPELDHNEVVGWSERTGVGYAIVALRHAGEHHEVAARFPLSTEIARASGAMVEEIWARGRSALARVLTLVLVGDLVSTYLGIARGVDPSPVDAIARLKVALAEA